eukprot:Skav205958  [mRNA]  locus=scaffold442:175708:178202:+ [translate_table: standard]
MNPPSPAALLVSTCAVPRSLRSPRWCVRSRCHRGGMEKLEEHSETGSAVGHSATSESSASASQQDTPSAPPPPTVPSFWEAYRLLAQSYQAERATLMQCSPRTTAGPSASPLHLPLPRDDVPSLTLTPSYRNLFAMEADGGTSERRGVKRWWWTFIGSCDTWECSHHKTDASDGRKHHFLGLWAQ